ncbi:alpha/beta family hydrolase [Clostridium nigeriense]|uniref:alpha/beta family hydrolase n=1 Tax=Clostridium nigeriense TaxID=1805470 RepID=UPI0008321C69|nr:alpha/beta family hydrolase [Clostridium nigeriense]
MKEKRNKKILKNIIISIFIIVAVAIVAFIIWAKDSYKPAEEAKSVFNNQDIVEVTIDEFITFTPKDSKANKGFIFYPGGKVDPEAYSVLAQGIAEKGYLVVIVPMPLDLAVLSPNKASEVIEKYSYIDTWAIGGHSLGGVMASKFASENDKIKGLALYASYPSGDELKGKNIEVISIYGSNDGVADLEKVKSAQLSDKSSYFEIEGGNHAQFGNYGPQEGDNNASISPSEQVNEAIKYTVKMLEEI